jgi:hypothetical protein
LPAVENHYGADAASEATSGTGDPFVVPGWGPTIDGEEFYDDPVLMLER